MISAMWSSKDVIDHPPQSATTCPKYATVLLWILNPFKNAFIHTELNSPPRLTMRKCWHCIFYVPILMLLKIASVPICNWLQKLPIRRTLKEWLLFSIFVGMTLMYWRTWAFLRWWYGGTIACLPKLKRARSESVNDHGADGCMPWSFDVPGKYVTTRTTGALCM